MYSGSRCLQEGAQRAGVRRWPARRHDVGHQPLVAGRVLARPRPPPRAPPGAARRTASISPSSMRKPRTFTWGRCGPGTRASPSGQPAHQVAGAVQPRARRRCRTGRARSAPPSAPAGRGSRGQARRRRCTARPARPPAPAAAARPARTAACWRCGRPMGTGAAARGHAPRAWQRGERRALGGAVARCSSCAGASARAPRARSRVQRLAADSSWRSVRQRLRRARPPAGRTAPASAEQRRDALRAQQRRASAAGDGAAPAARTTSRAPCSSAPHSSNVEASKRDGRHLQDAVLRRRAGRSRCLAPARDRRAAVRHAARPWAGPVEPEV